MRFWVKDMTKFCINLGVHKLFERKYSCSNIVLSLLSLSSFLSSLLIHNWQLDLCTVRTSNLTHFEMKHLKLSFEEQHCQLSKYLKRVDLIPTSHFKIFFFLVRLFKFTRVIFYYKQMMMLCKSWLTSKFGVFYIGLLKAGYMYINKDSWLLFLTKVLHTSLICNTSVTLTLPRFPVVRSRIWSI